MSEKSFAKQSLRQNDPKRDLREIIKIIQQKA
jgi:hypothetical protein